MWGQEQIVRQMRNELLNRRAAGYKKRQKVLGLNGVHKQRLLLSLLSLLLLMLPASRGGFVGACRLKEGAVQRSTLDEEKRKQTVLRVGTVDTLDTYTGQTSDLSTEAAHGAKRPRPKGRRETDWGKNGTD